MGSLGGVQRGVGVLRGALGVPVAMVGGFGVPGGGQGVLGWVLGCWGGLEVLGRGAEGPKVSFGVLGGGAGIGGGGSRH